MSIKSFIQILILFLIMFIVGGVYFKYFETKKNVVEEINLEENRISVNMSEKSIIERRNAAVQQSIEIVRRRIDETGVREPTIQRQGDDRIILQLPGVDNPERVKRLIGKTAKMSFQLVDLRNSVNEAMLGRLPVGSRLLPHITDVESDGQPRSAALRPNRFVYRSGE